MASKQLEIFVTARDGASAAFKNVGHAAEDMGRKLDKTNDSFLKRAKSQFGEESAMGQWVKMLKGAGAIAAIDIAGDAFGKIVKQADDLAGAFARGEKSAAEIGGELVKGLPVIGGWAQGLEVILGRLTGISAEIDRINQDAKQTDQRTEKMKKALAAEGKSASALEGSRRKLEEERAVFGKKGYDAEYAKLNHAYQQRIEDITREKDKTLNETAMPSARRKIATNYANLIANEYALYQMKMAEIADKQREENQEKLRQAQADLLKAAEAQTHSQARASQLKDQKPDTAPHQQAQAATRMQTLRQDMLNRILLPDVNSGGFSLQSSRFLTGVSENHRDTALRKAVEAIVTQVGGMKRLVDAVDAMVKRMLDGDTVLVPAKLN